MTKLERLRFFIVIRKSRLKREIFLFRYLSPYTLHLTPHTCPPLTHSRSSFAILAPLGSSRQSSRVMTFSTTAAIR